MKKVLALFLIVLSTLVNAQQTATTRTEVQFGDDTWVNVPLQFAFPFYGKVFTNSFMFSNGVVGFYGLDTSPQTSYCCSGVNVASDLHPSFNYTIMPMQTDLIPVQGSKFYVEGNSTMQKYIWQDIAEYSNRNNLNSFNVEIRPTGYIGIQYDKISIQNQYVTSAIIGDASKGEYIQHYHGLGMNETSVPRLIEHGTTLSVCLSNPLADTSCPGYAQAYHDQQCSINALYATTCPGYEQAYFTQQCTVNPLYNVGCTGYAQAYFNQQCSLDPLYNKDCVGYGEAYAKKMLLEQQKEKETSVTVAAAPVEKETVTTTQQTETVSVTSPTSVSPASVTSVVAQQQPVSQLQPVAVSQQPTTTTTTTQQTQKQQEERKTENQVASKVEKSVEKSADRGKMREAVAKVQKEISKEAQEAKTIEAQVATQGLVVGSMNYVPGFDAYKNALIPDVNAMMMARQYEKPVVDNRSAQRRLSGSNELRWQQMVESQYQIGK